MTKLTNRKLTIRGLHATRWKLVPAKTTKFVVYEQASNPRQMLVGRSGALRSLGKGRPVADSTSLTGTRWHRVWAYVGADNWNWESVDQACEVWARFMAGEIQ